MSAQPTEAVELDAGPRPRGRRYGVAVFLAGASLLFAILLEEIAEAPIYAPLLGAVAVAAVYGGLGPALVTTALTWIAAWVILAESQSTFGFGETDHRTRWSANLAVGLVLAWVIVAVRQGRERATTEVQEVRASVRELESLQALTAALAAAVTPSDVAHALLEETPPLVGARGGSLGLIDGNELEIVDPQGVRGQTHRPGFRMPLAARAPIAEAARSGDTVVVRDRATFELEYPDGAALSLFAHGALAVPLRVAGEVAGSLSMLFSEEMAIDPGAESIAALAADLGGQALERAQLYEGERDSRQALDRILRVAPQFQADTVPAAADAICLEACSTFGADVATLWRVQGERMALVRASPGLARLEPGLEAALADFPQLREAVASRDISFVPDLFEEATGEGLERVRELGLRSSVRTPIAIGGAGTTLVLVLSWLRVISEPDPTTLAVLRRFTDQAGLALEQVERRLAETEATRRADETRRLQEITAALAVASTAADVSAACLEHALAAVGADAGFVVLTHPERVAVELVAGSGYAEEALARWGGAALDDDVPFARAIASGEPVWALGDGDVSGFPGAEPDGDVGWVAVPLMTAAGVRGALQLAFHTRRELDEGERRWLQAIVSQCAQALERSRLYDAELLLRRRSERLQGMTAALSNARTPAEVAAVVVDEIGGAVGADGAALLGPGDERRHTQPIAARGYAEHDTTTWLQALPGASTPGGRALRRRASAFYESVEELAGEFPDLDADVRRSGHASFLFVPLVLGRRTTAVLVLSWSSPYALSPEERRFVEALAGQAAQALDRARSYETEQTIAETLQRSVLPESLPEVEGVELAARYLPGTAELDVGGDWYDVIRLVDGRLGLVVGDVVGKGVAAAATMAQLRNALRAFSLDRLKPSSTMARLNRLAEEVVEAAFATVVYVVVDTAAGVCRYTAAGHPPPLVAYPDGRVELLEGGRGLPLGASPDALYSHGVAELPAGSVLLLYTDGLVERRDRPIDDGLERLRSAVLEGRRAPEQLVEHVLERLVGEGERGDDIALLAVRLLVVAPRPLRLRVPGDLDSLGLVRDAVRTWLTGTTLDRDERHEVVLAVWEACANAVEHALPSGDGHVDIRAETTPSGVKVVVADDGAWRAPTTRADRGLGLRLMHSTMTAVDVAPGSSGTRVTLEKVSGDGDRRS